MLACAIHLLALGEIPGRSRLYCNMPRIAVDLIQSVSKRRKKHLLPMHIIFLSCIIMKNINNIKYRWFYCILIPMMPVPLSSFSTPDPSRPTWGNTSLTSTPDRFS
jgi:hypothetical protein